MFNLPTIQKTITKNFNHARVSAVAKESNTEVCTTAQASHAITLADYSIAKTTGLAAFAFAADNHSLASSSCAMSHAAVAGVRSWAATEGANSNACAMDIKSIASALGEHSVAVALGDMGRAMAGEHGAIVLVARGPNDAILHIRSSKVGENGIKPNTWYTLDLDGQFREVQVRNPSTPAPKQVAQPA